MVVIESSILRDTQLDPPVGYCPKCGCELYRYDGDLCPNCEESELEE